jgi:hypothetical protein
MGVSPLDHGEICLPDEWTNTRTINGQKADLRGRICCVTVCYNLPEDKFQGKYQDKYRIKYQREQ